MREARTPRDEEEDEEEEEEEEMEDKDFICRLFILYQVKTVNTGVFGCEVIKVNKLASMSQLPVETKPT